MSYSATKEQLDLTLEKLTKEKNSLKRAEQIQVLGVRILFDIFGELSSLSHTYREMLKIQQEREAKTLDAIARQVSKKVGQ